MFSKNLYFLRKFLFYDKTVLAILTFFIAALDAQQNCTPTNESFDSLYLCSIKGYGVFVKNISKLIIQSVHCTSLSQAIEMKSNFVKI